MLGREGSYGLQQSLALQEKPQGSHKGKAA